MNFLIISKVLNFSLFSYSTLNDVRVILLYKSSSNTLVGSPLHKLQHIFMYLLSKITFITTKCVIFDTQ